MLKSRNQFVWSRRCFTLWGLWLVEQHYDSKTNYSVCATSLHICKFYFQVSVLVYFLHGALITKIENDTKRPQARFVVNISFSTVMLETLCEVGSSTTDIPVVSAVCILLCLFAMWIV